jgi:hypothetical protein
MGLLDSLREYLSPSGDQLEPLLKIAGIDAACVDYDPASRQVVLALKIHGQTRYMMFPARRVFSRAEICGLIGTITPEAPAQPPPEGSS